ncbi:MAG: hypothetical protein IJV76_10510, partial [Clostridia bacterium]|nr:hypothetical protein [Clostridia bacterium]
MAVHQRPCIHPAEVRLPDSSVRDQILFRSLPLLLSSAFYGYSVPFCAAYRFLLSRKKCFYSRIISR